MQPALSVPIHVVELTNVPPELRMNTGSPLPKPSETRQVPETEKEKVKCKTAQANCGRKCNERDVCVPSVELKNFSLPSIFFILSLIVLKYSSFPSCD